MCLLESEILCWANDSIHNFLSKCCATISVKLLIPVWLFIQVVRCQKPTQFCTLCDGVHCRDESVRECAKMMKCSCTFSRTNDTWSCESWTRARERKGRCGCGNVMEEMKKWKWEMRDLCVGTWEVVCIQQWASSRGRAPRIVWLMRIGGITWGGAV